MLTHCDTPWDGTRNICNKLFSAWVHVLPVSKLSPCSFFPVYSSCLTHLRSKQFWLCLQILASSLFISQLASIWNIQIETSSLIDILHEACSLLHSITSNIFGAVIPFTGAFFITLNSIQNKTKFREGLVK